MAAGGWKIFTTGDVLTADDTMDYLQQGVLVFDSSGARGSAIAAPAEGQFSYLKDTDATEYYDGSAWTPVAQGGLVHIVTDSFSAVSSVSLDNCFSGDYDNYRLLVDISASSGTTLWLRFRASGSDSATGYTYAVAYGTKGAAAGNAQFASDNTFGITTALFVDNLDATYGGGTFLDISNPALARRTRSSGWSNPPATGTLAGSSGGLHTVATAYDGITMYPGAGSLTGTVSVYGYKK